MVNVTALVSDENLDGGFSTWGDEVQTVKTEERSASGYAESSTESLDIETSDSVPWRWHYPTWSWWQLVQLTSSVLGVVGQMLVMLVIWQRRAMNRSADTLIGALAVADFLTSILILPLPVAVSVPSTLLGEIYCRFVFNGFFMWLAVGASIHTLALISVERLIAIMYPILFNRYSSREKASVAVAVVWLELMITTLNLILTCSVEGVSHTCVLSFSPSLGKFFGVYTFLVYFIIPATVMLVAQAVTAVILHRKSKQFNEGKALQNRSKSLLTARKRVIQMLFVVVLIFIVCWGPNNVAYFLFNFGFISRRFAFSNKIAFLHCLPSTTHV
ncbi:neuromedin-U receptor 2-like [Lytechinus pictus]|uniref:neuromedin-U receptor 2-like n=1 Tax=Lytechinus pictus TaxID=7653 RepID=UPI0030B9CB14